MDYKKITFNSLNEKNVTILTILYCLNETFFSN